MNIKDNFRIIGSIVGILILAGGLYVIVRQFYGGDPLADAGKALEGGNYLAALAIYNDLNNTEASSTVSQVRVDEARQLLVAEDNFSKAEKAAEEERWSVVVALLEASDAKDNFLFKYYDEAKELLNIAKERVSSSEKKNQDEIANLSESIGLEKAIVKKTEQKRAEIQKNLNLTALEKQKTEMLLESTKKSMTESQRRADEARSQFEQEQKKVLALAGLAEQERVKNFLNELGLYVSLLNRGDEFLGVAISEIDQGRDTTTITLVTQARALFAETKSRIEDLRSNRTLNQYIGHVDELIQASSDMSDAAKYLGTSVLYIQDKNGAEFSKFYGEGKNFRSRAKELLDVVKNFIQSLQ